jgi:MFS family permease
MRLLEKSKMLEEEYQKALERNIKLYNIYKITTKRVFFPLIAVYLVALGNVTLFELGLIASISSLVSLVTELPAGYIADRYGAKPLILTGSFLAMISAGIYLFDPSFLVGVLSAVSFAIFMSLTSGAVQAFMYDTLTALGKKESYSKVMGYGQSFGLLGNVVLLSLIPLTYAIHPKIPFALGVVAHAVGFWCIYKMTRPRIDETHEHMPFKKIFSNLKNGSYGMRLPVLIALCILMGFVGASLKVGIYRSILLTDLGIEPSMLGLLVAVGSLFAAIVARKIHYFDRFNLGQIQVINALIVLLTFVFVGLSYLPFVAIITYIIYDVYMRNQSIILESAVFRTFPNVRNKSTLLSAVKTSENVFGFATPIVLASLVMFFGIQAGHLVFGVIFIVVFYLLFLFFQKKRFSHSDTLSDVISIAKS